ncbi:hypothetical protein, partial [Polymorphobacter multimanifer]|uniref:hypothetical protein n=1 Tax=Polymorphobacter multimanifer TaxID=1070431 RepID=UPI001A9C361C
HAVIHGSMINPAKPEIKAARPRTYTTLWDTIVGGCGPVATESVVVSRWLPPSSSLRFSKRNIMVVRYLILELQSYGAACFA